MAGAFCVLGLCFLVRLLRITLQQLKFGEVRIQLHGAPPSADGELSGRIALPARAARANAIRAELRCFEVDRDSDGESQKRIWEGGRNFPVRRGATIAVAEFSLRFPAEAEIAPKKKRMRSMEGKWFLWGDNDPRAYVWKLAIRAELQGVDLSRSFVIETKNSGS